MTRVLVIGLDGVPLDLIRSWAQEGKLLILKSVMDEGVVGSLRSTLPPISAPAWSSFMTGKNPGKTGIYDFLYRRNGSYVFPPNDAHRQDGKSIWNILSAESKRVGVLNVPMTYPVESVNGFMISGWMTPYMARDFVYPPHLLGELQTEVGHYRIYPSATFSEKHKESFLEACNRLLDLRTRTALYLMQREPWDFFMVVFFDTDRILHQMWHYLDRSHPWHSSDGASDKSQPVWRYFQRLDRSIGQLIHQAGDDTLVVIMSDHGMGPAHNMIVLNNWLLDIGLLQLKDSLLTKLKHRSFRWGFTLRNVHNAVDRLGLVKHAEYKALYSVDAILKSVFLSFSDVDWSRSKAYSFGRSVGPIYLNVKGREPQGIIKPGREYDEVRDEIAGLATELTDPQTGRKLVGRVLRREEIYSGPYLDQAPDLTLLPCHETDKFFGLADFGSNQMVQKMYRYSGMHLDYGLLMMMGPQIERGAELDNANIVDLAPTILYAMGVSIPQDMDGRPLAEAFAKDDAPGVTLLSTVPTSSPQRSEEASYTAKEAREIEGRLRQMGYLG
jgi:predicted AlkP superfamily phosphohydrolase/phosphomutase